MPEKIKAGAVEFPAFRLHEAAVGQLVVRVVPMTGNAARWHYLVVREGEEAALGPKHRPVLVQRTVEGVPGGKPLYDSGELPYTTEMLANTLVVDASHVTFDWTETHAGLMIVTANCWTGIYWNDELIHTISPHEIPYRAGEIALVKQLARAIGTIPLNEATADRLLDDLSLMQPNMRLIKPV